MLSAEVMTFLSWHSMQALTVDFVVCQYKFMLLLAFRLYYKKNLFCQLGEFQLIALSPACYLLAGRIMNRCDALFSSVVNDEQTVTNDWMLDKLAWSSLALFSCAVYYFTVLHHGRMVDLKDSRNWSYGRHSINKAQKHITDTKQTAAWSQTLISPSFFSQYLLSRC